MRELIIAVACGAAVYVWLAVVAAPVAAGLIATSRSWTGRGWRRAILAAFGVAGIATAIPAAAVVAAIILAPAASLSVMESPAISLGLRIGILVWAGRSFLFGLPRLSPGAEITLAMAAAGLLYESTSVLRAIDLSYREFILSDDAGPDYSTQRHRLA